MLWCHNIIRVQIGSCYKIYARTMFFLHGLFAQCGIYKGCSKCSMETQSGCVMLILLISNDICAVIVYILFHSWQWTVEFIWRRSCFWRNHWGSVVNEFQIGGAKLWSYNNFIEKPLRGCDHVESYAPLIAIKRQIRTIHFFAAGE